MNWAILVVAGIFRVGWAIGLKYIEGFTRLWPGVWAVLAMIISLGLLGIAMKTLRSARPTALGWGGSCRHRRTRDCAAWRVGEPGSHDQCCPHSRGHCGPQALNALTVFTLADRRFGQLTKSTMPFARLYMAPVIWIDPFFSRSANTGLRRRMFSSATVTLVRATAST
jgi:hypothetical protein